MRFALLLLASLSMNAIAAPCQVKLQLMTNGLDVVNGHDLSADQLLARQALTDTIETIIEATKSAGLELVEDGENRLTLDLHSIRDNEKVTGTAIDVSLKFENKYGATSKIEFSRESSLPFFARVGFSSRAKAQIKELNKRAQDASREISALPGCR